jgi:hypothetical protein
MIDRRCSPSPFAAFAIFDVFSLSRWEREGGA